MTTAAFALSPSTDSVLFQAYRAYADLVSTSFEDAILRAKAMLRKPGRKPIPQGEAVFPTGWKVRMERCPRCGQLLQQEPGGMYCRWGCTRRFPLEGAPIAQQFEWERHSGLIGPSGAGTSQLREGWLD